MCSWRVRRLPSLPGMGSGCRLWPKAVLKVLLALQCRYGRGVRSVLRLAGNTPP